MRVIETEILRHEGESPRLRMTIGLWSQIIFVLLSRRQKGKVLIPVKNYVRRALPREFAVLGGPNSDDDLAFRSDNLQILWNCSDESWADPGQHYHHESDEVLIVLKGSLDVEVGEEQFTVEAGEICFFPAGMFHAITGAHTPIEALVIRAPATQEKVFRGDAEL